MKILTFERIKAQLRLDDEQAEAERDLLEMYGESAETALFNLMNRTYQNVVETYGEVPTPIAHAALLLVDHYYKHRSPGDPQSLSTVPYGFDILVKPYMRLADYNNNENNNNNGCTIL